jgi:hypothetical protein
MHCTNPRCPQAACDLTVVDPVLGLCDQCVSAKLSDWLSSVLGWTGEEHATAEQERLGYLAIRLADHVRAVGDTIHAAAESTLLSRLAVERDERRLAVPV